MLVRSVKASFLNLQGFPMIAKKGWHRAASPVSEREVSLHSPLLLAAACGKNGEGESSV